MDYYGEMAKALEEMNSYLEILPSYLNDSLETFFIVIEEKSARYKFMCTQSEKTIGRGNPMSYTRMRLAQDRALDLLVKALELLQDQKDRLKLKECAVVVLAHVKHPGLSQMSLN